MLARCDSTAWAGGGDLRIARGEMREGRGSEWFVVDPGQEVWEVWEVWEAHEEDVTPLATLLLHVMIRV